MLVKFGSDDWFRQASAAIWKTTVRLRQQYFHGLQPCPQRVDPLALPVGSLTCQACSELINATLVVARDRLRASSPRFIEAEDVRRRTYKLGKRLAGEAREKLVAAEGMTVRPSRLLTVKWFREAVSDPITQKLVIQAVFFARSGDAFENTVFPYRRWANRFDLTPADARSRLLGALVALREARPEWVENNIDRPLMRCLSAGQHDGSERFHSDGDGHDQGEEDDEAEAS